MSTIKLYIYILFDVTFASDDCKCFTTLKNDTRKSKFISNSGPLTFIIMNIR